MIWLSPKPKIKVTWDWTTISKFKAYFQPYCQLWGLFSRYSVPHWISFQRLKYLKLKYFGLLKTVSVWKKRILFLIQAFIKLWEQILGIHLELEESSIQFRKRAALNRKICPNILLSFNQPDNTMEDKLLVLNKRTQYSRFFFLSVRALLMGVGRAF